MINSVPAEDFEKVYPLVERFFQSFTDRADGGVERGYLEREVIDGQRLCYVATRGRDQQIVACGLATVAPNGGVTFDYCAGDDMEDWPEEMLEMFETGCAKRGVPLTVVCRTGWVRRLMMKKRGYRESHRVMEFRNGQEAKNIV